MTEALLVLQGIVKTFRRGRRQVTQTLNNVSLDVHRGEIVALVGESGSGKSTLGRVALGLLRPDAGRVRFDGHDFDGLAPEQLETKTAAVRATSFPTAGLAVPGVRSGTNDRFSGGPWRYFPRRFFREDSVCCKRSLIVRALLAGLFPSKDEQSVGFSVFVLG